MENGFFHILCPVIFLSRSRLPNICLILMWPTLDLFYQGKCFLKNLKDAFLCLYRWNKQITHSELLSVGLVDVDSGRVELWQDRSSRVG